MNEVGRIAAEEWEQSSAIRKEIEIDTFVVMPNHLHGINEKNGGLWKMHRWHCTGGFETRPYGNQDLMAMYGRQRPCRP